MRCIFPFQGPVHIHSRLSHLFSFNSTEVLVSTGIVRTFTDRWLRTTEFLFRTFDSKTR